MKKPPRADAVGGLEFSSFWDLAAVVQLEFQRVYLQAHFFDFLSFEFDVAFEQVVAENVALFEEGVVRFQRVQRLLQREGDLRDVVGFFRRQVVEVFVHRLAQPGGGKSGGSAITPGKPQRRRTHGGERDDWRVVVARFLPDWLFTYRVVAKVYINVGAVTHHRQTVATPRR